MNTKTGYTRQKTKLNGRYLLLLVTLGYALLYYFYPDKTLQALLKSLSTLLHLLPVFLVVIVLMGIFTALMNAKKVSKLLGKQSGIKGWLIALTGGILSHGSSYIWYQMLVDLREQKVKDGLIVTFLYTRAIKLPWLPLMVSYFGYAFTVILMFYIIIGAFIQGQIVEKLSVQN
jgi:uncharacterized membrane protein YraQ (UPF0718 family)